MTTELVSETADVAWEEPVIVVTVDLDMMSMWLDMNRFKYCDVTHARVEYVYILEDNLI